MARSEPSCEPEWGRTDAAGAWLNPRATWTLAVVLVSASAMVTTAAVRYNTTWTPLQRLYLRVPQFDGLL